MPATRPAILKSSDEINDGRRRSMENLKPFTPGKSGNRAGRPKGKTLRKRILEILDRTDIGGKQLPDGKCVADVLAESIVREALKGKFPFVREIMERLEGKVPDRLIDETPDADVERDRAELADLITSLSRRGRKPATEGEQ